MIALLLAFIILCSLTLWFVIGADGIWWIKTLSIILSLYFGICLYIGVDTIRGYPSTKSLPKKFEVHYLLVKVPNKITEFPGHILVWITSLNKDDLRFGEEWLNLVQTCHSPRVYQIEYSKEAHKAAQQVQKMLKEGKRVVGESSGNGFGAQGDGDGEEGEGKGGKGGKGSGLKGKSEGQNGQNGAFSFSIGGDSFNLYEMPPPVMPAKIIGE